MFAWHASTSMCALLLHSEEIYLCFKKLLYVEYSTVFTTVASVQYRQLCLPECIVCSCILFRKNPL